MSNLTDKQKAFVEEYLVDLNASAAARRAGYSEKTARYIGYENLTKPHIKEALAEARQERQERTQITQDMVVEGLLQEARNEDEAGSTRVQAWKALGKHLSMFVDRVDETSTQTIEVIYTEE